MSDIQILTGAGILVSGYIQLCNIAACNWQLLIWLAWFSSLTHLGCLTMLRTYLNQHPIQRAWRLTAMFAIVVLLLTAIGSTGNYDFRVGASPDETMDWTIPINDTQWNERLEQWRDMGHMITPLPTSLAVCHFYMLHERDNGKAVYLPSVFSILLLGLSFLSRIIKAFKTLGGQHINHWLSKTGNLLRRALRKIYPGAGSANRRLDPRRTLVYWPLLMGFVTWSIIIDFGASLTLEIWFLVIGFCWGIMRIIATLDVCGSRQHTWSFGQILPVFLLIVPLLTLIRLAAADDQDDQSPAPSQSLQTTYKGRDEDRISAAQPGSYDGPGNTHDSGIPDDDPFQEFNTDRSYVNDTTAFFSLLIGYISCGIIVAQYFAERDPLDDMFFILWGLNAEASPLNFPLVNDFFWLYGFLYLRFNLEILINRCLKRPTLRKVTRAAVILSVFAFWLVASRGWLSWPAAQPFLMILLCPIFWVLWHCSRACQAALRVWIR